MALNSRLKVEVSADQTSVLDLASGSVVLAYKRELALNDGSLAGQANRIFHDTRTLAASVNEDLDLAGTLTDAFGQALTFAKIKGLVVAAAPTNTNNLIVGAAAANAFASWLGAATHTVIVRPGGVLALFASDLSAYPVVAGTGDLLRIANSGAGTQVVYDVIVIGTWS